MLYREIIAVCSQIHTKHINTLCGQNVEYINVKAGGVYSYHFGFNGSNNLNAHQSKKAVGIVGAVLCNVPSLIFMYEHPFLQALHNSRVPVRA